jgi:TonB family protein
MLGRNVMSRWFIFAIFTSILIGTATGQHTPPSSSVAAVYARDTVFNPKPQYPESLRKRGIGGQGEFLMHVDSKTGKVTSVDVLKSTGVPALDQSCVRAFGEWRFKRNHSPAKVRCPVRFNPKSHSSDVRRPN